MKAPAVKPNHQEERQSKDPHLGYELMIASRPSGFSTQQSTHGRGEVEGGTVGFNGPRSQTPLTREEPVDYLDRGEDTERLFSGSTD